MPHQPLCSFSYATENSGRNTVRSITFENEILGVWFNMNKLSQYSGVDKMERPITQ